MQVKVQNKVESGSGESLSRPVHKVRKTYLTFSQLKLIISPNPLTVQSFLLFFPLFYILFFSFSLFYSLIFFPPCYLIIFLATLSHFLIPHTPPPPPSLSLSLQPSKKKTSVDSLDAEQGQLLPTGGIEAAELANSADDSELAHDVTVARPSTARGSRRPGERPSRPADTFQMGVGGVTEPFSPTSDMSSSPSPVIADVPQMT